MGDMSKLEYLTTDWIEELRDRARNLRREAQLSTVRAEEIDEMANNFERRVAEHEKWASKKAAQTGG